MLNRIIIELEASQWLNFSPIKLICNILNLQLIEEGHTLTICSDIFVIDINTSNNQVNVLFVDENFNNISEYLNEYFAICLNRKNFLLFYVLLKHFLKYENHENGDTLTENISEILMRLDPIILYKNGCGKNLLFSNRLIFCECILDQRIRKFSLEEDQNKNIFTHHLMNEKILIKNDIFEIKENSFFLKNKRSPEMSYLWKNGFSAEEILDFLDVINKNKL